MCVYFRRSYIPHAIRVITLFICIRGQVTTLVLPFQSESKNAFGVELIGQM